MSRPRDRLRRPYRHRPQTQSTRAFTLARAATETRLRWKPGQSARGGRSRTTIVAMDTGFISPVRTGYEDLRAEVARTVEAVGFRPVMAENRPASLVERDAARTGAHPHAMAAMAPDTGTRHRTSPAQPRMSPTRRFALESRYSPWCSASPTD